MSRPSTFRPGQETDACRSRIGPIRWTRTQSTDHRVRIVPTVQWTRCARKTRAFCLRPPEAPRDRASLLVGLEYSRKRPSLDQSESIFRGARTARPAGAVRGSLVDTVRWSRSHTRFAYFPRPKGEPLPAGVSAVKGVVPLESMIQMSVPFGLRARSRPGGRLVIGRRSRGQRGSVRPASPQLCRSGQTTSTGMPWRHPFGKRSFPSPKRKRRRAQRTPAPRIRLPSQDSRKAFGAPDRTGGRRGLPVAQTATSQTAQRHRMCRRRSAVSCPANRASRDRSRGHPRFRSRRRGTACRLGETQGTSARTGPRRAW